MENEQKNSLPEFDSNYIDQLFSAGRNAPKPEPVPAPAPAEPEPASEVPEPIPEEPETAPAKPGRPKYLLILAAAGLLILGFLCGTLIGQGKEPSNVIPPPATTLPPQFGFLPSYESWSTDSLAVIATELPILWDAPVTQENFTALAGRYQVLEVLADRDDALDALQKILKNAQPDGNKYAAAQWLTGYISTYVPSLPPCKWLQIEDSNFAAYELAEPHISVVPPTTANGTSNTLLVFNRDLFAVDGEPEILKEECNFWFLLEKKEGSTAEIDPGSIIMSDIRGQNLPDARMALLPCEEGWLVCGYAPASFRIRIGYTAPAAGSLPIFFSPALPENLSTEKLLLQTTESGGAFQRYLLSAKPANFRYHPLMAALLERENLIPVALQMAENNAQGRYSVLMSLLAHESVQERMTEGQKEAYQILKADRYLDNCSYHFSRPSVALSGHFAACRDFYLTDRDARMILDTEADHWIVVTLTSGAMELNDGSWYPEAKWDGSGTADFLYWPIYPDSTGQIQSGWLVAVHGAEDSLLRLTLRNGKGKIIDAAEEIVPLILPEN